MSLRENRAFRTIGYVLFALAILGFTLHVVFKVLTGDSLEPYRSGTLVQWTYGGALVVLLIVALLGIYWVAARAYERWKQ